MQYRPDAPTLLAAVAELLDEILADVPAAQQHRVRVAAHLTRLVERETRLGAAATADERIAIADLLRASLGDVGDLDEAVDRLAAILRSADPADEDLDANAWGVSVEVTRRDLEIAKPGHADWTGT